MVFVLYAWTANKILVEAIKNVKDKTMVRVFKNKIIYLAKQGFKPCFNIMDNVTSKAIHIYLEQEDNGIQIVEPHNHRINTAKRAVQTFKNHFLVALATCDKAFPLALLIQLVRQVQDNLTNMMCRSRTHPKLPAYHVLEGSHDFNKVP